MNEKMKIFLYEASPGISLVEAIKDVEQLGMEKRVRHVANNDMKLEQIVTPMRGIFAMDFCKHRDSGPGRAKRNKEIQSFELGEDEAFGEMTAVLYDSKTHFLVIQYNHYGPRPGSIGKYFSHFGNHPSVKLEARLKDDILAEIDRKQFVKEASFSYSTAALTKEHREKIGMLATLGKLESTIDNIAEVKIIFKAKRNGMAGAKTLMTKIFRISEDQEDAIKSAGIRGSETLEDELEFLNILKATIYEEREGLKRDEKTHMYSFESRYKLLIQSFNSWKRAGIITSGTLR